MINGSRCHQPEKHREDTCFFDKSRRLWRTIYELEHPPEFSFESVLLPFQCILYVEIREIKASPRAVLLMVCARPVCLVHTVRKWGFRLSIRRHLLASIVGNRIYGLSRAEMNLIKSLPKNGCIRSHFVTTVCDHV
jgi:hypothetical protein